MSLKYQKHKKSTSLLTLLLEIIVIDFDAENDAAADGGDEVRDEKRPKGVGFVQDALEHETCASYSHHEESWQGYAIRVPRADGLDGLGKIAKNHRDAGHPTQNTKKGSLIFHNLYMYLFKVIYNTVFRILKDFKDCKDFKDFKES